MSPSGSPSNSPNKQSFTHEPAIWYPGAASMLTVERSPAGAVVITASPLPVVVLLAATIAVSVASPFELLVIPPPRLRVAGSPPATEVAMLTASSEARTPWSVIRIEVRIERFFERSIVVAVSPAHP